MSLHDQLAADLATICADSNGPAVAATYLPKAGGNGIPLRLLFERGASGERDGSDGKTQVGEATAHIPVAVVPVVKLFDVLTVTAIGVAREWEQWSVEQIIEQNAAMTVCNMVFLKRTRLVASEDERSRK